MNNLKNPSFFYSFKIPRVFKIFQNHMDIEHEWSILKKNIWNHKYKTAILASIIFYPLYNEKLSRFFNYYRIILNTNIEDKLSKEKPLTQVGQGFLKHFVVNALKDEYVKEGGLVYVQDLIKQRRIIDASVQMLQSTIKEKDFLDMVKKEGKVLGLDLLKDKDIHKDASTLVLETQKDPVVKFELLDQVRLTLIEPEIKRSQGDLFGEVFGQAQVQVGMKKLLEDGFGKLMQESETVDKTRVFMYNLANSEMNSGQIGNKSLLELMMKRAMNRDKKDLDTELDRFIKMNELSDVKKGFEKRDLYNPELQPGNTEVDGDLNKDKAF